MSDARLFHSRTPTGDAWSLCHFWSNFEVADLDFFRSAAYRSYFAALDATAGFYYERWGDAAVHSLAAALFLAPAQLHWFEDWGYRHPPFQHCPREGVGWIQGARPPDSSDGASEARQPMRKLRLRQRPRSILDPIWGSRWDGQYVAAFTEDEETTTWLRS
ncbi:MAG: hypothetical protein Q9157_005981 [Trypethelium eluteriae]